MEIINLNLNNYKEIRFNTAVALGNFDGIHIAHKKLILEMVISGKKSGLKPSILLFSAHTKQTLEGKSPSVLTSIEQKIEMLKELGVEVIYKIDFDDKLRKLSPNKFVTEILINKLNSRLVCVGFDYRFGFKASGDSNLLKNIGKKYGINTIIIDPIYKDNIISSTRIRKLIEEGKIETANDMLGYEYSIIGKVVDGNKVGTKLGFPTANLDPITNYIIPKLGIYETNITIGDKTYLGATSIGTNPTFNADTLKIENHIIDFNDNIYGEMIKVGFIRYLREEIKFDNIDDLKQQINKDIDNIISRN